MKTPEEPTSYEKREEQKLINMLDRVSPKAFTIYHRLASRAFFGNQNHSPDFDCFAGRMFDATERVLLGPRTRELFIAQVVSPSVEVQELGATYLGELGRIDSQLTSVLLDRLLRDPEERVRTTMLDRLADYIGDEIGTDPTRVSGYEISYEQLAQILERHMDAVDRGEFQDPTEPLPELPPSE